MRASRAILAAGLSALLIGTAAAEDAPGCTSFAWSVARERAAFANPDLPALTSGSALPVGAVRLALEPTAEAKLPLASERAAKPGTFAGFVAAMVPAAGTYQVTVSDDAWIDASQDGRTALKPIAISGEPGCPAVRKSLRFALDAGPVTILVARTPRPQIMLDLVAAE